MSVKLREKQLSSGQISFYLDIYHNKTRWYEFLDIHIQKNRPDHQDKEKKRLAQEIRAKREHELIVEDNGLTDKKKKLACFVKFFEDYVKERNNNGLYFGILRRLQKFAGKQPVPFSKLSAIWMKDLERYLLIHVSNNTTLRYLKALNGALNEAVRRRIINRNPWHDVPHNQRLKMQDVFRNAFTIEQLQQLANTQCKIDKQIKQAYFFSCFTGLRWSDVNPLRWDEIIIKEVEGEKGYYLYFEQEKTEAIEYLPVSDNAIDIIKERQTEALLEEKSPYVFPQIKEIDGTKKMYQRVLRALKTWARSAEIDPQKLHFHSGRHTFATNVLESSAGDLYTVSKLLGHKDISSTQIYAKVRDKRKQMAVKALPKINFNAVIQK
ncbi:MAG: site-specific integrase [Bacteroidia bacterium]|nr:site-specific integrase [Bacteroidia bacterium]